MPQETKDFKQIYFKSILNAKGCKFVATKIIEVYKEYIPLIANLWTTKILEAWQ